MCIYVQDLLEHLGGCPTDALIGDCYSMYLAESGMLEPLNTTKPAKRLFPPPIVCDPSSNHEKMMKNVESHSRRSLYENPYSTSLGSDSPNEYYQSLLASPSLLEAHVNDPDLYGYMQLVSSDTPTCASPPSSPSHPSSPPAPRQRIEILSWPPAAAGETWEYQWRTYLDTRTVATGKFFHM